MNEHHIQALAERFTGSAATMAEVERAARQSIERFRPWGGDLQPFAEFSDQYALRACQRVAEQRNEARADTAMWQAMNSGPVQ